MTIHRIISVITFVFLVGLLCMGITYIFWGVATHTLTANQRVPGYKPSGKVCEPTKTTVSASADSGFGSGNTAFLYGGDAGAWELGEDTPENLKKRAERARKAAMLALESNPIYWAKRNAADADTMKREMREFLATWEGKKATPEQKVRAKAMSAGKIDGYMMGEPYYKRVNGIVTVVQDTIDIRTGEPFHAKAMSAGEIK